ncbi:MAG: hypothetical protein ACXVBX_01650 [Flavisolibacter sp.]
MKKIFMVLFLAMVTGLFSCINSLNPLVTSSNVESFDAASGLWKDGNGTNVKIERFRNSSIEREFNMQGGIKDKNAKPPSVEETKLENNVYILSYNKNKIQHYMILSFTRLNGQLFTQLEPLMAREENENMNVAKLKMQKKPAPVNLWDLGKDHTYSFAKVEMNNGQLQFIPLDEDYLEGLLDKGAMAIPFEKDDWFGSTLITASPDQLEKFFSKYGSDERVFNKNHTLVLKPAAL